MALWKYFAQLFGSFYTLFIVIIVNLSVVLNGMSLGWTSPELVKLSSNDENPLGRPITQQESDMIGNVQFFSALIGPLLFLRSSEKFGRKGTILLCLIPCLLAYAILTFAKTLKLFYLARILSGLTMGPIFGLTQSYLSELIYSVKKRGSYLAVASPAIHLGIFLCNTIGPYVSVPVFNGIIFIITFFSFTMTAIGCPESPYFILEDKGKEKSLNILKRLDSEDAEKEVMLIEKDMEKRERSLSFFTSKESLKPFLMSVVLLVLQQLSGVAVVFSYSQQIFLLSSEVLPAEKCSIIVGLIMVLSATLTTFTTRKFPRKSLLIFSLLGVSFFDLVLGLYFLFSDYFVKFNWIPLVALVFFVVFYNSGLDPLPWVYLGEIFPPHSKSVGSSISLLLYWSVYLIISLLFTTIHVSYLFLFGSATCFLGVFYVKLILTETKDKTLRDIQRELDS